MKSYSRIIFTVNILAYNPVKNSQDNIYDQTTTQKDINDYHNTHYKGRLDVGDKGYHT